MGRAGAGGMVMAGLFGRNGNATRPRSVARAPRTQDQVLVVAAQDNALILRNFTVVAAVTIGSMDDTLLTASELEARLMTYRDDLLKRIRFDFQMLIGTRPQDLRPYYADMEAQAERWREFETRAETLRAGLETYLESLPQAEREAEMQAAFAAHFGFEPGDLSGTPGGAHEVALRLCAADLPRRWQAATEERRQRALDAMRERVEETIRILGRWQDLIYERAAFVDETMRRIQAPVRTLHLVVSHQARPLTGRVSRDPLSEAELRKALETLDERCDQLVRGIQRMRLSARRATHEELLEMVRHFYNPSQAQLARRG